MAIDEKTVRRVAHLARLALPEARVAPLAGELNAILAWIEQLNEVNVDGVEAMTTPVKMSLPMREDVVSDGNIQAKVLVAQNTEMKSALKRMGIENPAVASRLGAPPPKVDGRVRAATADGLVEVSLGSDDGLMRGHTLEVFRDGATPSATKYLGRIEILSTKADVAVGKVMPQYRRGNIEKDDRVATRLN